MTESNRRNTPIKGEIFGLNSWCSKEEKKDVLFVLTLQRIRLLSLDISERQKLTSRRKLNLQEYVWSELESVCHGGQFYICYLKQSLGMCGEIAPQHSSG